MSKKMKGVALDSSPFRGYDDAKARFRHQSLLEDFQDLQKETETAKVKLEGMKQKKLILLAEVRFLRRRYKILLKNQIISPSMDREIMQSQHFETESQSIKKERKSSTKRSASRKPVSGFDGKQKERNHTRKEAARKYSGKEAALWHPQPGFELNLNQKERIYSGKEAVLQNPSPILDLNQNDRTFNGKEAARRNPVAFFDLNQISREEEESQLNSELTIVEELRKSSMKGGNDEQYTDMKLSAACRNIGNGPRRAGKRKISWQDPVALRV